MDWSTFEQKLRSFHTTVYFSKKAERDFKSFSKGKKSQILLLILKQAQKGADFKPNGNGNRLDPPLHQFAKIKSHAISLRVVYRPVSKKGLIEMQIMAIGPRNRNKVYKIATERLISFFDEINSRKT